MSSPAEILDAPDLNRRNARIAGLIATGVTLTVLWTISSLVENAPFAPTALAERVIRETPGDVATFFIDHLKHWALRLLTIGVLAVSLIVGAEAPVRTARAGRLRVGRAAIVLGALAAVASLLSPMGNADAIAVIPASALGGALYAFLTDSLYDTMTEEADLARRRTLRLGVGGAIGLGLGSGIVGWLAGKLAGPNTDVPLVAPDVAATIPVRPPFPKIAGQTTEVTSADDHYVVDINLIQPSVEADGWTLKVFGDVETPLELGFTEMQNRYDVVEEYAVLTCISNEVGGSLVGHSRWGGVRLADVLSEAGIGPSSVDVVFRAADGYSDSIPIEIAMNPTVLLAVSQNGEPLHQSHGFPCRVRIPAIYGMKNVKWVESIEVVGFDYKGYWMKRGWSDRAVVHTQSRIDVAGEDHQAQTGSETWIAGVAWAGDREISKVEVSTDGAQSWAQADLKEPIGTESWRLWAYRWTPDTAGRVEIACRAVDGEGNVQTAEVASPHPAGATGYHRVSVDVS